MQELIKGKKINYALYSSSIMLSIPRFSLLKCLRAVGGYLGTRNYLTLKNSYTEIVPANLLGRMEAVASIQNSTSCAHTILLTYGWWGPDSVP